MSLISLVYVSFASHLLEDDELKAILKTSRDNNPAKDVTGMLLYRDGFFIQALEGESDVVEPLYDKIKQDDRHKNVTLVYRTEIAKRTFPNWTMGFNRIEHIDLAKVEGYTPYLDKPFKPEAFVQNPSRATVLLQAFKDRKYF